MVDPASCDTFVAMSDVVAGGAGVVFGKNSDRPRGEVQEVVFVPGKEHQEGEALQCTYICIPQSRRTLSCVLSKPAWMWGAEMGVNEAGVAVGNEAVWDRTSDEQFDLKPRLLGMDLLRLSLERGSSAESALDVLTSLLERHGQGGQCSDIVTDFAYHNSFLLADAKEAWVLETARHFWVAERVRSGVRNISNCMSIRTKIDKMHPGLKEHAVKEGWWDGKSEFDWAVVIGGSQSSDLKSPHRRFQCGKDLLENFAKKGSFSVENMMSVLRDEESEICRSYEDSAFPTAGSQVSLLCPAVDRNVHFFTGTADPSRSVFKPTPSFAQLGNLESPFAVTSSPSAFPQKTKAPSDRAHPLWALHRHPKVVAKTNDEALVKSLRRLEMRGIEEGMTTATTEGRRKDNDDPFRRMAKEEADILEGIING